MPLDTEKIIAILTKKARYVDHILREATETELHPENMKREDSSSLGRVRKSLIVDLREIPYCNMNPVQQA
jgi:hypothetical protein